MRLLRLAVAATLLVCLTAAAEPPPKPMLFERATEIYTATSQVRMHSDNAVYAQTHLQDGLCFGNCTPGEWVRVDLKPFGVSADAKAAFLAGLLIITHGTESEISDLHITFKAPSATGNCAKYIGQAIEAHIGGGQRSSMATWVPLEDGLFDWCYTVGTDGAWPTNSAYGVNLSLQAWTR